MGALAWSGHIVDSFVSCQNYSPGKDAGIVNVELISVNLCTRSSSKRRKGRVCAQGSDGAAVKCKEIRVCTNKTCRKGGALETLDYFRGLAPSDVNVEACGCLGQCGAGPNAMLLPEELFIRHCNTAAHVARLLETQCGAVEPETNLQALDLKNQGSAHFGRGDAAGAEALFAQAIELQPSGGLHNLYANRSAARALQGNAVGAVEDAREAQRLKPGWSQAYLREAEGRVVGRHYDEALRIFQRLAQTDAELRRSKSFLRKLRECEANLLSLTSVQ